MTQLESGYIKVKASPEFHLIYGGSETKQESDALALLSLAQIPAKKSYLKLKQTHGTNVITLDAASQLEKVMAADGVFTAQPNLALVIRTADCMPLFFWDERRKLIGVVHAGWRGLFAGILENAVALYRDEFKGNPQDLKVSIGPSIRACCYEVSSEFEDRFGAAYYEKKCEGHGMLAMQKNAFDRLVKLDVPQGSIQDVGICTCCDERYHSYRRNKTEKRNLSIACLGPNP